MTRLEIRNLPAAGIRDYLIDEFGGEPDGDRVVGDGWEVLFIPGEPALVGRLRVPVLFLEVRGSREQEAAAFLRRKTMRGGG